MNAHVPQQKAFLFVRMLVIDKLNREVIVKNGLCFLKRNLMLFQIRRSFAWMPLKLDHMYIVCKQAGQRLYKAGDKASPAAPPPGMLIAATAIGHPLVLATRNVRGFMGCTW